MGFANKAIAIAFLKHLTLSDQKIIQKTVRYAFKRYKRRIIRMYDIRNPRLYTITRYTRNSVYDNTLMASVIIRIQAAAFIF